MISNLFQERKIDKLYKKVDEDLTIIYKKDEKFKEETKGDQKEEVKQEKDFLKPSDIFDKEINIMVADYLSAKKIKQLQDNIHKVCKS